MVRYIGLDLHKDYIHGYCWTPGKEKGRHFRFPNSREAWERFIQEQVDSDCHIAFEVTGNAFQVYDLLAPHAGQLVAANPVELKRLGSGRHTDRVDAERLAKMLALGDGAGGVDPATASAGDAGAAEVPGAAGATADAASQSGPGSVSAQRVQSPQAGRRAGVVGTPR